MAQEEDCMSEMFVLIRSSGEQLAVPLSQLHLADAKADGDGFEEMEEAIADWRYWTERGYQFG